MSALCRLAGRQICSRIANNDRTSLMYVRAVTMKPEAYKPVVVENHDDHNMSLKRPMSPHLTIYSPQVTSMLSISHRFTGCILAGYTTMLGLSAFLPGEFSSMIDGLALSTPTIMLLKISIGFPMSYHFWNGIRHLLWDMGMFLNLKEVYSTGYIMLGSAAVSTAFLLML